MAHTETEEKITKEYVQLEKCGVFMLDIFLTLQELGNNNSNPVLKPSAFENFTLLDRPMMV